MFWGSSGALDMYQEYLDAFEVKLKRERQEAEAKDTVQQKDPSMDKTPSDLEKNHLFRKPKQTNIKILLIGSNDPRHVLKTVAKRFTHRNMETLELPTYDIFVLENNVETFARDLALLSIAFENPKSGLSVRRKTHLFMDIYGNSQLRPSSEQYLVVKTKSLMKILSDPEERARLCPMLNIDFTKYKELDGVQCCFDFWSSQSKFMITNLWDNRLRNFLAERYDYRSGTFDWDYNMVLLDRGATQICSQEYNYWRETGIAFTFPEYEQTRPNKTLALGVQQLGSEFQYCSFQGDIQVGPFCTFGLDTTEHRMKNSSHGQNEYRATDITERNLLEIFYELENGKTYEHDLSWSHRYGSVRFLLKPTHEAEPEPTGQENQLIEHNYPWLNMEGVKIYMMGPSEINALNSKISRWEHVFDVIFVGKDHVSNIRHNVPILLRGDGLLVLETMCFTCERKEKVSEFEKKLIQLCKEAELMPVLNYDALNKHHPLIKYFKKSDPPAKSWSFIELGENISEKDKRALLLPRLKIEDLSKNNVTTSMSSTSQYDSYIPKQNLQPRPPNDQPIITHWPIARNAANKDEPESSFADCKLTEEKMLCSIQKTEFKQLILEWANKVLPPDCKKHQKPPAEPVDRE